MPTPPTVVDTVAYRFSDQDILVRVAEKLSDGSMAFKVDIVRGGDLNIGEVQIQNVAGAVINPATEDTLVKILGALDGVDLPVQTAIVYDSDGNVTQITETDGASTKQSNLTYDADGNVTNVAEVML